MHNEKAQKLSALATRIDKFESEKIKAVIGFDGFVDEIVHVVDKRLDTENFIRLESMGDYGERIKRSAGLSTNIEMVTIKQKLGGNGPIFANALIEYGFDLTYIGALGIPDIHPVFKDMVQRCKAFALSNPAFTDAIEFFDGKIISSKLESLKHVNWSSLVEKVGIDAFANMLDECDLIAFVNWTMIFYMSEIWEHIISDILPKLKKRDKKPILFIDLADPEKRKKDDVISALSLINRFSDYFEVIFGLNKKEACEIAGVLDMPVTDFDAQGLEPLAKFIYSKMNVSTLVIHPVKEACAITKEGFVIAEGPYCRKPKLTTGAGDNFNAGFALGITLGFNIEESLLLGTATSGFYVRKEKSPNKHDIAEFLKDWSLDRID